MMRNKIFSEVVLAFLLFNLASPFARAQSVFGDVALDHPNYGAIEYLKNHNVMTGYQDGTFKPASQINRAELMKVLVAGQGLNPPVETYRDCFSDIQDEWFASYVCYAKSKGWVSGYPDGTFKAANNVTRAEAAKMVINAMGVTLSTSGSNYSDVPSDAWFKDFALTVKGRSLLDLTTFGPSINSTRAEIAEFIFRIIVIKERGSEAYSDVLLSSFDSARTLASILTSINIDNFSSNGAEISGWWWVRSSSLTDNATWRISNVPSNQESIDLEMYVLATNTYSGGKGYDAKFRLYYGDPDNFMDLSKLKYVDVELPNVSTPDDPVGYNCKGTVNLPLDGLNGLTNFYFKAVRIASGDNHVAFNKESIIGITGSGSAVEGGYDGGTTDTETGGTQGGGTAGTQQVQSMVDTDSDGVPDYMETLLGTGVNNPDSDSDTVSDGKDLSPLLNPSEPTFNDKQKIGMVRLEQPIQAIGLDGWVELYDWEMTLHGSVDEFVRSYETEGTKKSVMTQTNYKKTLNKLFDSYNFICYKLVNISPSDIAVLDTEMTHDMDDEDGAIYPNDALHQNEYRFHYDYITDYQRAFLKNDTEIKYPSESSYFKYLLYPVKLKSGYEQSISVQFKDTSIYSTLTYTDDSHYKIPAFMYSFYNANDFNLDTTKTFFDGVAVASINDTNVFTIDMKLPKDKATRSSGYLKITPVWAEKNGTKMTYSPMDVGGAFNVTGLTRNVVLSRGTDGDGKSMTEEFNSFDGLNTDVKSSTFLSGKTTSTNYKSNTSWLGLVKKDPNAPTGEKKVTVLEMTQTLINYVDIAGGLATSVVSQTENMVTALNKVNGIDELPETHWARSPKYGVPMAGLNAATGVISIGTNGYEAWSALMEGNYVDVTYYAAQTALSGVSTAAALATISEQTVGYAGKAGKLAKLTSKKAAAGLAIAVGVVEVAYDAYQLANTNDPILETAYSEQIGSDVIDTGLSVASVFVPHVLAFQLTWTLEVELYGLLFGEDFAYKVAQSPGSAVVFLYEYFISGDINSVMATEVYESVREDLITQIENWNEVELPYLTIFIDPDLT